MSLQLAIIVSITIYKIICLIIGLIFSYFGYKLFINDVRNSAGELAGKFDKFEIIIKHATPGTFYAILGAAIVITILIQGIGFEYMSANSNPLSVRDMPKLP